jgi:hypothetical protein
LMADDLRVRRDLFVGGNEVRGESHGPLRPHSIKNNHCH